MFDITSLQYNSENPTLVAILLTVSCSLILGIMIAFTYEKTSKGLDRPNHFLQAMVLVTIVAATILQAIGDSVARGLGMLGALSIIRFRTTIRDPRNIVFMFSAIAAGIACGVFGFTIAICGTIGFCTTAFLLRLSPFSRKATFPGDLKLQYPKSAAQTKEIEQIIKRYTTNYRMTEYKYYTSELKANLIGKEYRIYMKNINDSSKLISELQAISGVKVQGLSFSERQFDRI